MALITHSINNWSGSVQVRNSTEPALQTGKAYDLWPSFSNSSAAICSAVLFISERRHIRQSRLDQSGILARKSRANPFTLYVAIFMCMAALELAQMPANVSPVKH
ncbi:MAG: hypothetical protein R2850_09585 [Bacteroidia bacterium]